MQNASARSTNTNSNTNSADSSSSSNATADNTNNIDNTVTASSNQNQNACAVALTCPEGSTTVTRPPDPCPHSPYTDFVGGLCQNGAPTFTCTSLAGALDPPSGPFGGNNGPHCEQTGPLPPDDVAFINACVNAKGKVIPDPPQCEYPATPNCPPPEGSTQMGTVVNGRCTIQP